jgi:hypothetical protein
MACSQKTNTQLNVKLSVPFVYYFFDSTGVELSALALARQALYHLSYNPQPFFFFALFFG